MAKEWIPVKEGAKEDTASVKKVEKSGLDMMRRKTSDTTTKESTQITYEVGGAWKGTFKYKKSNYDTISTPEGAATTEEGAPEIPQEGIYVAVPNGATNVSVKLVKKEMQTVSGTWKLKPTPKPITEEEYIEGKEEYKPKKQIYDSNKEYPGKDFEFLGLKNLEGVTVAHLIVYLAQYKPLSGVLSIVKTMTLEISYKVPPTTDAVAKRRTITPMLSDMILDFKNLPVEKTSDDKSGAYSKRNSTIADFDTNMQDGFSTDPSGTISPWITTPPTGPWTNTPSTGVYQPTIPGAVVLTPIFLTLKKTTIASEYVIITPNALKTSVDPLLKAKSGWPHYGMVATTETISSEFPAASLKDSIKAFLTWAWDNWQVPPRYVVLAGDTDIIPVNLATVGGVQYASDHYYADIHDSLSPEIVVSRLPTSDANKLLKICQKLAQYADLRGPDWGGWQNELLLVAYEADTYKTCSDEIATIASPRFKVTKKYGDSSTKQEVTTEMNDGVIIANYRGHGSKTAWSSINGLNTQDIKGLTNDSRPPMVFCVCCQNAWIDDNNVEVVVETFLREGKAVAVIGASRNSPTYANNDFDKYFFKAIMNGATNPGSIFNQAKALMVANHSNSTEHMADVVMYMLFGDPTTQIVSTVEFLRGTWDMDHDGWKGVLEINRIWQHRIEVIGSCGYPVWSISGTYSSGGKTYPMSGKIGGKDENDLNAGCKRSDHKLDFAINFEASNPQKFAGYITTWTRNIIAGYTWWANRPFCWYAKKRIP
jgi:hypothetical protein